MDLTVMAMPGRSRRRRSERDTGFTLTELMVGVMVLAGLMSTAYLCLHSGMVSRRTVEARIDLAQAGRVALAMIVADLRAATTLSEDYEFVGLDRVYAGIDADNVDFGSRSHVPRQPGESDFSEVSYFISRNPQTRELGLWRRRDATPDQQPFSGGRREEIVTGVDGFSLEYYDGFYWYDSWGPEPGKPRAADSMIDLFALNLSGLPTAVRITLSLKSPSPPDDQGEIRSESEEEKGSEPPFRFQTVVYLNLQRSDTYDGDGGYDGYDGGNSAEGGSQ